MMITLEGENVKTAKVLTGWIDNEKTSEIRLVTVHIDI
jgi:hypothetical protein